jgi:hypothetical protein
MDTDGDNTADCDDECPDDANKILEGACGCGVEDKDTDKDGALDCDEFCDDDPNKIRPGDCGCGVPDLDVNPADGMSDCLQQPTISPTNSPTQTPTKFVDTFPPGYIFQIKNVYNNPVFDFVTVQHTLLQKTLEDKAEKTGITIYTAVYTKNATGNPSREDVMAAAEVEGKGHKIYLSPAALKEMLDDGLYDLEIVFSNNGYSETPPNKFGDARLDATFDSTTHQIFTVAVDDIGNEPNGVCTISPDEDQITCPSP